MEYEFEVVNFDDKTDDDKFDHEKALIRHEFLEILVRIAKCKYIDTGMISDDNNARALHRLVNTHLLPVLQENKLPEWQPFRNVHLWTNDVNDLLVANA